MTSSNYNDEIKLGDIVKSLWREKLLIITTVFVFTGIFVLYALSLPNKYKSTVITVPSDGGGNGGLSALANQFGGLASIAGVNLNSGNTDLTVTLETLKSKKFLMSFIEKYDLGVELMAVNGWSITSNTYSYDDSIYNKDKAVWVREVPIPKQAVPSSQELYLYMKSEYLNISHDPNNNVISISFTHFSPKFAHEVVTNLVNFFNENMRLKDIKEAEDSIAYLTKMARETSVQGHRDVFFNLIEQQQQKKMLASIREDYSLEVVDPAIIAEDKASPKRAMLVLMGAVLGFILSSVLALFKQSRAK